MKHQYFGDTRDLFKYDLITRLVLDIPDLSRFIIIPMLTADDGSPGGGRTMFRESHAGYLNKVLTSFLAANRGSRDITRIVQYFRDCGICMDMFGPPFLSHGREGYFSSAATFCRGVQGALIFIDPDNGLEVKRSREKHLLFSELLAVCTAAAAPSLTVVYQHFPRVCREVYVQERLVQLRERCRQTILAVADNQVVFFLLPSGDIEDKVASVLLRYAGEYRVLRSWTKTFSDIDVQEDPHQDADAKRYRSYAKADGRHLDEPAPERKVLGNSRIECE